MVPVTLLLALVGIAATLLGALWVIKAAPRIGLMDHPGQRRMHRVATPRGGGVGMASGLAALAIAQVLLTNGPMSPTIGMALGLSLLGLAWVGLLDDRRGLPILPRLATHLLAAALTMSVSYNVGLDPDWFMVLAGVVVLTAATNLANFFDGLNGILTLQVAFVLLAAAVLPGADGDRSLLLASGLTVLAFLPFNFPRARCFMGDVASGPLGFWTAYVLIHAVMTGTLDPIAALLLPSAVVIDTGATLLSRVMRGKRFWRAHREHLYQWLARGGFAVFSVNALYLGWSALSVVAVLAASDLTVNNQWFVAAAFYAIGGAVWWSSRRWLLRSLRQRSQSSLGKRATR